MNFTEILFHPVFVHFPIALCFFEVLLLSMAKLKKHNEYLRFARLTFHVLAVCLIVTLASGYRDAGGTLTDLFNGGVKPHFVSACLFTLIVLTRLVFWKRFGTENPRGFAVQLAGSLVMTAVVVMTAYWGGKLVYS